MKSTFFARSVVAIRFVRAFLLGGCLILGSAHAEKADHDQNADVTADHFTIDDLNQVDVLTGHVVLSKGSMRLAGERMEHRQDEHGYQHYLVTARDGELASFHQRRDPLQPGVESTIEGTGERIDYDDQSGRIVLSRHAIVKRLDNGDTREMASGERIVYDSRHDTYEVDGHTPEGKNNRVHLVIPPHGNSTATDPALRGNAGVKSSVQPGNTP